MGTRHRRLRTACNNFRQLDPVLLLHFVAVPGLPVGYILFCGSDHSWQVPSLRQSILEVENGEHIDYCIIVTVLVAVTVVTNGWQAREVARQTGILAHTNRALLAHQVESEGNRITQLFLRHPELYPYFVDNIATPQEEPIRRQVCMVAKLIVDHMCLVIQSETLFNKEYRNAWRAYFQDITASSPAIREYWQARRNWYEAAMKDMMDGITPVTGPATAHQQSDCGRVVGLVAR